MLQADSVHPVEIALKHLAGAVAGADAQLRRAHHVAYDARHGQTALFDQSRRRTGQDFRIDVHVWGRRVAGEIDHEDLQLNAGLRRGQRDAMRLGSFLAEAT